MPRIVSVVFCSLLFLILSRAHAFTVEGFRSGMKKDDVLRVLEERGSDFKDKGKTVYATSVFKAEEDLIVISVFHFCQERLAQYQKGLPPSMKYFIVEFQRLSSALGQPASSNAETKTGGMGEFHKIVFSWRKSGSEWVRLSYGVLSTHEQVFLIYDDEGNICP